MESNRFLQLYISEQLGTIVATRKLRNNVAKNERKGKRIL